MPSKKAPGLACPGLWWIVVRMLSNAGVRSGTEIGDSKRDAGLVIQHLSDNALNNVAIKKAIAAAVVQRPAGAGFGRS